MLSDTRNGYAESFESSESINSDSMGESGEELILGLPSTSTAPFTGLSISVIDVPKSASGRPKRQASSRINDFVAAEVQLRKDSLRQPRLTRAEADRQNEKSLLRNLIITEKSPSLSPEKPKNISVKSEDVYPCCYCEAAYQTLQHLENHILTHVKPLPHECTICKHSFSSRETLTKHVASHLKQRKFSCPLCPMAFSQRGKLKLHLRTHSGERPYKCTYNECLYAAAQKGNLTVHMRAVHGVQ